MDMARTITVDPNRCGGRPCIRGLRIRVRDVLDLLAAGASRDEILEDHSLLEADDITAVLEFAARENDPFIYRGADALNYACYQDARFILVAPLSRDCRIVTVIDGHPATLAWLGCVVGHRVKALGVEHFGQTGTVADLYRHHGIDANTIAHAAQAAASWRPARYLEALPEGRWGGDRR